MKYFRFSITDVIVVTLALFFISQQVLPKTYGKVYVGNIGLSNERETINTIHQIENLKYGDRLDLHLTTTGGDTSLMEALIEAAEGKNVHVYVDFYAYSAGAVLLCYMPKDKIHLKDKARILFHRAYVTGRDGKEAPGTRASSITYTIEMSKPCLDKGFITNEEMKQIIESEVPGDQVILSGKQLKKRLGIK